VLSDDRAGLPDNGPHPAPGQERPASAMIGAPPRGQANRSSLGRFSQRFIADLTAAREEHGATALARTARAKGGHRLKRPS
jgi:hypothetical protein